MGKSVKIAHARTEADGNHYLLTTDDNGTVKNYKCTTAWYDAGGSTDIQDKCRNDQALTPTAEGCTEI